ncbi:DUF5684 domain-containing protein [Parabacteroides bouchesdurhonensis]|uniref:DUF5684 domain-containing protein n=1 Tax=Parabacteroides bouchesdurhonensis TaxID=1936995 RepID=UPI000E502B71|nr:DUF5684 domain-containing protein [Parabacteroides bouchesdurhonensis]RHJ93035.1 signal peptidase I [Bacteroides sp. AM07-16]
MIVSIIQLLLSLLVIVSLWKIFEKFGEAGWASIIPIYNLYVLIRIVGWEPIKILFFLIPLYNIYLAYVLYRDLAAKYGKDSVGFVLGILFLPFIFLPILAFKSEPVA